MQHENETEDRLALHGQLFEAPGQRHGATNKRIARPRAKAREAALPGRSERAERKATDAAAAKRPTALTLGGVAAMAKREAETHARRVAGELKDQELQQGGVDFYWRYDRKTGNATYEAKWYADEQVSWRNR